MAKNKKGVIKKIIQEHVVQNYKEYTIVFILFVIGLFLGVFFINHAKESQTAEIHTYLNQFIEKLKSVEDLNQMELLKSSLGEQVKLSIIIWFFGTTVIGIPVVFGMVIYRGFCLGYTISACISMMGFSKGFLFTLLTLVLQNIFFIPALLALAVSGYRFYKSIIKDRGKENIKLEMIRHTLFSATMLLVLGISSVIEILVSTGLLKYFIKNF